MGGRHISGGRLAGVLAQGRTIAVAATGAAVGHLVGLPGGALVGALLAVIALGRWRRPVLPSHLVLVAQLLIGGAAGALVTRSTLIELWQPLLLGAAVSALLLVVALLCGAVLARISDLDPLSCMLAFIPGGLSEIAALAEDYDIRTEFVIAVHLLRRLVTVALVVAVAAWAAR